MLNLSTTSRFHGRLPVDSGVLMCLNRHCDHPAGEGLESGLCPRHEADRMDEMEDRIEQLRRQR